MRHSKVKLRDCTRLQSSRVNISVLHTHPTGSRPGLIRPHLSFILNISPRGHCRTRLEASGMDRASVGWPPNFSLLVSRNPSCSKVSGNNRGDVHTLLKKYSAISYHHLLPRSIADFVDSRPAQIGFESYLQGCIVSTATLDSYEPKKNDYPIGYTSELAPPVLHPTDAPHAVWRR